MLKLLYIHCEEKIKQDDEKNFYTDGSYNNEVWKRYLNISNDITAIFRKESKIYSKKFAIEKFEPLDKRIKFIKVEDRKQSLKKYFSLKVYLKNKKIIENEVKKSDLIIVRTPSDESYYAIKYARKYNKEIIVEVVGCPFDTLWNHSFKGKLLSVPTFFKMKHYIKKSKNVMYVTKEFLQKRYPSNGNSISCSDVIIELNDKNFINRIEKINKINLKEITIGTIGTLNVKYKGHRDVIKAIKKLSSQGYNIKYLLVGSGDQNYIKKILKREKCDNVEILGMIPHEQVLKFLDNIDIYIHPSHTEGLCRALIEAISRACPCIVSNAGGNPEVVSSKYVYKKGNYIELSNKIKEILSKRELVQQAEKNYSNAKYYEKNFLNNKRNKFYKKIINKVYRGE